MPGALLHTFRLARAGLVLAQHGVRFVPKGTPVPLPLKLARIAAMPLILISAPFRWGKPKEKRLTGALSRLGPSYMKLGQFLATRADVIGPDLADELWRWSLELKRKGPAAADHSHRARLTLADADAARAAALAAELGGAAVDADAIMTVEADVFSPCALGAILDAASIARLNVPVVAGAANNQLARPEDGDRIQARGILYAPDYVINAGGIINVALEYLEGAGRAAVEAKIKEIPARLETIWAESAVTGDNPARVADRMAQKLIGRG